MNEKILQFIARALACASLLVAAAASAASADGYAVLSLLGDDITIVTYQPSTGTNVDPNHQERLESGDDYYDRLATQTTMEAIRHAMPKAALESVQLRDRSAFRDLEDVSRFTALAEAVRPQLKQADVRYLAVISRFRGDARLRVRDGSIGNGKLSGLGFYIDDYKRMRKTSTGEAGRGFLAPFAYVKVTLVDLQNGSVVGSASAGEAFTRANAGPDVTLHPWDMMNGDQKVALLDNALRRALRQAVPQAMGSR